MNSEVNLKAFWRGDRSPAARAANAEYKRLWYLRKAKGISNLVSAEAAKQMLLTFEDCSDAAKTLNMPLMTIWTIRKGKVKRIKRSTEERILQAA